MIGSSLKNAWKVNDLRKKIGYTLFMLIVVYRIGAHVPVPFINHDTLAQSIGTGNLVDYFDTFAGGAFKRMSVFALGITPYITASIIMQLLTIVIPKLERLSKEGDYGKKQITQYTRYATVVFAFISAYGLIFGVLRNSLIIPSPGMEWLVYLIVAIVLTAGTAFLMWLGESITEKGIGNGISLIIFAGIVSRLPDALKGLYDLKKVGEISAFSILTLAIITVAVIAGVVFVQEGQRRIPVQYAKRVVGRRVYGGQSSHIPLKVNQAGVIPIIFAISLVALPGTIASWFPATSGFRQFADRWLTMNGTASSIPIMIFYALLIVFFTYFYTAITFNPMDVADNLKKYGGFIPGLRPGRPTAEYISKVLSRITLAGGLFLALIAVMPTGIVGLTGLNIAIGGTSLLIVVGVALDTMKQIESQLTMRHYQGFMR